MLSEKFAVWVETKLVPWVMNMLRKDPDVTLAEYQEAEAQANKVVADLKQNVVELKQR